MSITDEQDVEVPEAEPLPADDPREEPEDGPRPREEIRGEHPESNEGPPPLPPLLETGASSLATAGAGIYTAAGPAGLAAAAGVAGVAGAAYGVRHLNNRRAARAAARGGTFGGGRSGVARQGLLGGLTGRNGAGGARTGRFGAGGRGAGRGGARSGGPARKARTGAGGGTGGGLFGRSAGGRGGGRPGGGGGHLFGSRTGGSGGGSHRRTAGGTGAGGLFGRSGAGARSGRSGGGLLAGGSSGAGRRGSGRSGGGLFGGSASGRSARRARSKRSSGSLTAITDPAVPIGSGRGRARRLARAGWNHPRTRRARAATRRGLSRGRTRITSRARKMHSYLRKRRWVLRLRGWGRGARDWWSRLWDRLRGRASDPRYGRLKGWQLTAAAAAIGAVGAGRKKSQPRVLTGRIIGTAAPVPGERPFDMVGRSLLAITTGTGEEPLAPEAQRVRDAAEELKQALAALGGSQVGMLTYEQGLKELGGAFGTVADGVKSMSQTAEDEQPLASEVLEFFGTIEDSQRGAAQVAEEMPGLFRAAHEVELGRLENPRRGEHKWDVSQQ